MNTGTLPRFVTFLCVMAAATASVRASQQSSPVGTKIESFTLKDYRGKTHLLDDYRESKLVVVAFLGTECPLAKLYMPRLVDLAKTYESKGVAFLGVNANRQDSITEIAAQAQRQKVPFPILKDLGNKLADSVGAVRTPEVFLLDEDRVVRYWGRIDNQYDVGVARDKPTREDLKSAVDELLAGKPVSEPVQASVGCFIGRIREPVADADVTYSNQIARIFQKRCVECHREGEIAPFTLTSYQDVVGWAETIDEVVRDNRMPPWHASPEHGDFVNDRRMTDEEKQLVYRWVDAGAPEGDASKLPEPQSYVSGWQLPQKPDRVVYMREEPYRVPAEGTVRYQYFQVDSGFTEDKWVSAAQILPGNPAVVHHVLVFCKTPEGRREFTGDFLAAYVPGLRPRPYSEGTAKRIPAGSKFVFQVHYTPIGTKELDRSKLGLVFADAKDVRFEAVTTKAANTRLKIPPGADNHRVEAKSSGYPADLTLLSMSPHMHLRGKAFRYEAIYPDGKQETLLDVPEYDFNWQTTYRLREPKLLPAGTRMYCVAHFDNSAENPFNPDPTKTVRWGDQTWEEMMIGYFDVAVPREPKANSEAKSEDKPDAAGEAAAKAVRQAKLLMNLYDKDMDGVVKRNEVPARLRRVLKRLDLDGNNELTQDELAKALMKLAK